MSGNKVQVLNPQEIDWDAASGEEYRLRQEPGPENSLGLVKFMFPNPFNVYLHDTPADNLFDHLTRSLSHGCVRLERPDDLAEYVLKDMPEWSPDKIEKAMHGKEPEHVSLKTPLPIHFVYWTAWADNQKTIHFSEDIYGYDATQQAALLQPQPPPPSTSAQ